MITGIIRDGPVLPIYYSDHRRFDKKTQRPFKTIEEAISFAKARPEKVSQRPAASGICGGLRRLAFQGSRGIN